MIFSELLIATQDDQIDLLRANRYGEGVGLTRYTPGAAGYKDGGIWADSPLAPGRRRVAGQQTNYVDALQLKISYKHARQVIETYRDLKFFEGVANSYWDDEWQQSPVWLVARVTGETARRYAIIYLAQLSDLPDPYHEPFQGGAAVTLDGISLGIERGPWTDTPPLQATQVPLTNTHHGAASNDWVHISNGYNPHGALTHIYAHIVDEFAAETDSGNLLEETPPYALFPGIGPEIDSAVYFGADYPFFGLVFNFQFGLFPAFGTKAIEWEYWNGAAWSDLNEFGPSPFNIKSYRDATNELGNVGIRSMVWSPPDDWEKNEPYTYPEKYWVRARIAAGFTYSQDRPMQIARHVYALSDTPYVEVAGGQTDGDIDNLLRLRLCTEAANGTDRLYFPTDLITPSRVIVALRSYARGANFVPWINLDGAFNVAGLNAGLPSESESYEPSTGRFIYDLAFVSTPLSPIGKMIRAAAETFAGDTYQGYIWLAHFTRTILQEYYGEYRIFARAHLETGAAQIRYSAHFVPGEAPGIQEGGWVALSTNVLQVVDLGRIRIPLTSFVNPTEITREVFLKIEARVEENTALWLADIFLLPIDEWAAEVTVDPFMVAQHDRIINIDSALNPRRPLRCVIERDVSGNFDIERTATLHTTGEAILHSGTRQRIFGIVISPNNNRASAGLTVAMRVEAVNRYTYLR